MKQAAGRRLPFLSIVFLVSLWSYAGTDRESLFKTEHFQLNLVARFRVVGWDDVMFLSGSDQNRTEFIRQRTSLAATWTPDENFSVVLKLTNEFRYYFKPTDRDFTFNEMFVDNAFIRWIDPGNLPLTLTLGRQNITLGEGFVVMDGHPLDGSRSIYFNAGRADWRLSNNQDLTLFYTYQPVTDDLLPILNDQEQLLIEQPERGLGAYYTGKWKNHDLDIYYIEKWIDMTTVQGTDWIRINPDSNIHTLGSKVRETLPGKLSLTLEGAIQSGVFGNFDRKAWGWNAHLEKRFSGRMNEFRLGGFSFSGDDPDTEQKWEGWDPVFSRWPKWSESYIYTLIREYDGKVAYWSNIHSVYGSLFFHISDPVKLELTVHHLRSHHSSRWTPFPGGTGRTRGILWIGKLDFRLGTHMTGHLLYEHFNPGDFYFDDARSYNWLRFELMLKL